MKTSTSSRERNNFPISLSLAEIKSPAGRFFYISDSDTLLAGGFRSHDALLHYLDSSYDVATFKNVKKIDGITEHLVAYNNGDIAALKKIKVKQPGGDFYQKAWNAMRKIPTAKVATYSELAEKSGNSKAVRAAGSACARNAVALVVPCHRVVKTGGALGNYAYGVEFKEMLLEHEVYFGK
jgi:methylated-DNA-[protein]-cysteine S-methyltransferase